MDKKPIKSQFELEVYKLSFDSAMRIFEITKTFPKEEKYFYPVKYLIFINY